MDVATRGSNFPRFLTTSLRERFRCLPLGRLRFPRAARISTLSAPLARLLPHQATSPRQRGRLACRPEICARWRGHLRYAAVSEGLIGCSTRRGRLFLTPQEFQHGGAEQGGGDDALQPGGRAPRVPIDLATSANKVRVPTTLIVPEQYSTIANRFPGLPFVTAKAKRTRALANVAREQQTGSFDRAAKHAYTRLTHDLDCGEFN